VPKRPNLWGSIIGSGLVRLPGWISLSDHFRPLPARTLPARLPDGADAAPGVQGRRTAENAVLRRQIGRVRYEPADWLWLAALLRLVPRRRWGEVFPVTPATVLAWHRRLVARKWDYTSRRCPGRPSTAAAVRNLVIRIAAENPGVGPEIYLEKQAAQDTCKPFVDHGGTVFRRHGSLQTCRGGPVVPSLCLWALSPPNTRPPHMVMRPVDIRAAQRLRQDYRHPQAASPVHRRCD
jgi:hypothetical protein